MKAQGKKVIRVKGTFTMESDLLLVVTVNMFYDAQVQQIFQPDISIFTWHTDTTTSLQRQEWT